MENQENNNPPFSETSLDFTEPTAKISLGNSSSWAFEYEDFTIESWIYCKDLSDNGTYLNDKAIFGSLTASRYKQQFLFYVRYNGTLGFWNGYTAVGGGKLENNKWHHVALCRRNLRIYMYLDGKLVYNGCESSRFRQTSNFSVGAVYDPYVSTSNKWTRYFDGYMQDLRVIKDFAVYTCNFVPSKKLLEVCPKSERCPAPPEKCLLYISYEFNMPWYMGGTFKTNTHVIEIEKNKAPFTTSHIFMTTQKVRYAPGTNTSSIRNVKIKASNDTEWAVVEVDLNTRHEEVYSRNSGYTAVSFNLKIPSVLNDCTHQFENPTPTPEPDPWPTPTPIPEGVTVITIIPDSHTENDVGDSEPESVDPEIIHTNQLLGFGNNVNGQLGVATSTSFENSVNGKSVNLDENINIVKIQGSYDHTLFLTDKGDVYATGSNGEGQLGDSVGGIRSPAKIYSGAIDIQTGYKCSLILDANGKLYASGLNEVGEVGLGTNTKASTFTEVLDDVKKISTGAKHSFAIKNDGSLWATGRNTYGQLGLGTNANVNTFTKVLNDGVKEVSAGGHHSVIVKTDGSVWATGNNTFGQLGNNKIDEWSLKKLFTGPFQADYNSSLTWLSTLDNEKYVAFKNSLTTDNDENTFIQIKTSGYKKVVAGTLTSFIFNEHDSLYMTGLKSEWDWLNFLNVYSDKEADSYYYYYADYNNNANDVGAVSAYSLVAHDIKDVKPEMEYSDNPISDFDFISTTEYLGNRGININFYNEDLERTRKSRFVLILHKDGTLYGQGLVGVGTAELNQPQWDRIYVEPRTDANNSVIEFTKAHFGGTDYNNNAFPRQNFLPEFTKNVKYIGVGHNSFFCVKTTNLKPFEQNLSDSKIEVFAGGQNNGALGNGSVFGLEKRFQKICQGENISYIDGTLQTGAFFVKSDGSLWCSGMEIFENYVSGADYGGQSYLVGESFENKILEGLFNVELDMETWTKSFKDTEYLSSNLFQIIPAPSEESDKIIKISVASYIYSSGGGNYRGQHFLILKNDGSVWVTGSNGNGQLGLAPSNTEVYQKSIDGGVADIFTSDSISYIIDSGRNLRRLNGTESVKVAEDVKKYTEDGCYVSLGGQYIKLGNTIDNNVVLAEDVVDATMGRYILKSDGSIIDLGASQNGNTLLIQDDDIVSLNKLDMGQLVNSSHNQPIFPTYLKSDGSYWKLDPSTKNSESIIRSGVTFVKGRFVITNNSDILPKTIEFTPTPTQTPIDPNKPTPTPFAVLTAKGRAPLGDNTLMDRTHDVDILKGEYLSQVYLGTGVTFAVTKTGEAFGWKNTISNRFNPWWVNNIANPFEQTEFSSHLFEGSLSFKPSKTILQDVGKIEFGNSDFVIYKHISNEKYYLVGKYGTHDSTTPYELSGITDVRGLLMYNSVTKKVLRNITLGGNTATDVLTDIDNYVGSGYGNLYVDTSHHTSILSTYKQYGHYYIKSGDLYFKPENVSWRNYIPEGITPSMEERNYGSANGVVKTFTLKGITLFLTDSGELFSKYSRSYSSLTRSTGYTWNPHWTFSGSSHSGSWGYWGNFTVTRYAPTKYTFATGVVDILPENNILKSNGKIHKFSSDRKTFMNAPDRITADVTNQPITDATLFFDNYYQSYSYYEPI